MAFEFLKVTADKETEDSIAHRHFQGKEAAIKSVGGKSEDDLDWRKDEWKANELATKALALIISDRNYKPTVRSENHKIDLRLPTVQSMVLTALAMVQADTMPQARMSIRGSSTDGALRRMVGLDKKDNQPTLEQKRQMLDALLVFIGKVVITPSPEDKEKTVFRNNDFTNGLSTEFLDRVLTEASEAKSRVDNQIRQEKKQQAIDTRLEAEKAAKKEAKSAAKSSSGGIFGSSASSNSSGSSTELKETSKPTV